MMFISIVKELKCVKHQVDDEYESSAASQERLRTISDNINLNHVY